LRLAIRLPSLLLASLLPALWSVGAWAAPSSDSVLPRTTKGYVSVAQPEKSQGNWQKTQFGQMLDDEMMQPFVEDLKKQLEGKFGLVTDKLGITWNDLEGVPAGELSLAIIEESDRPAAVAVTIDVTGRAGQADELLAAVERQFAERGGTKKTVNRSGTVLHVFDVPAAEGGQPQQTVYFIQNNLLCGVDDRQEAEAMLKRFAGSPKDNLRSVPAYAATMERCRREAKGLAPEVRWFVDPFGLIWAARTLGTNSQNLHGQDVAKILSEQGFAGIQGVGGYVNLLAPGGVEVLYRVSIYAPPAPGKENDPLRWNQAMRMLQLPNSPALAPESWVPRMSASYTTFNLDLQIAFDNFSTLFDALQGHRGAFETTLKGWKEDAYGPLVDVRKDFVGNMGQRVTIVTDYSTPITVSSERSLFAIEATDQRALAKTLEKWMSEEPDVERRELGDVVIWERVPPQAAVQQPQIEALGFSPLTMDDAEQPAASDEEDRDRVLPNSASCVALGHLIMASDINFLREILAGFGQNEMLTSSADYQQVATTMDRLAPGPHSTWSFARTDETYRPTYELVRQGKMPESETMFGKLLNNLLTTEVEKEEGVLRKQRIDGTNLPSFEMVRRYFGPAGRAVRSDKDGWFLTGAVLNKEAP
jgi:hypothetical protein